MKPTWYSSLLVQIMLLLTLALFPLGAVAIYQTNRVASEADRNAQLALLALTGRAAKAEELLIERAFGAARVLGTMVKDLEQNPDRCAAVLSQFVTTDDRYSFVGILPRSGLMTCNSQGQTYDFADWPNFDQTMAAEERTIVANTEAPLSGQSVFIVSEPYEVDGLFGGFVSISIPYSGLPDTPDALSDLGLEELITFNENGAILTSRAGRAEAMGELPSNTALDELKGTEAKAFQSRNQNGTLRTYTVVPIEGSPATVMGVWRTNEGLALPAAGLVRPALFPVLMWFASMGVAMLAIYMLVLRHLNALRARMRAFSDDRDMISAQNETAMPTEILALHHHFDDMTHSIVREEANLEDALHDKNVLIKEVHHRVKNNLQLISSIMNMQMRMAEQPETRSVLSRLQERVLSLATIHRDLYQSQNGGMVNMGALVSEVIDNSVDMAMTSSNAINLTKDVDPILLYPDQAVPLSLLVAEATTNAMKYIGAPKGTRAWMDVSLKQDDGTCTLSLKNALGPTKKVESTGLGKQLMDAFAIQLGARIESEETTDSYALHVHFKVADFEPISRDF